MDRVAYVLPQSDESSSLLEKEKVAANKMGFAFGMQIARHVILKEIKNGGRRNWVLSPLSLHAMLNLAASGSAGDTLDQFLSFLESESIEHLNKQSSEIMHTLNMVERSSSISRNNQEFSDNPEQQFLSSQPSLPLAQQPPFFLSPYSPYQQPLFYLSSYSPYQQPPFFLSPYSPAGTSIEQDISKLQRVGWDVNDNAAPVLSFVNGIWVDEKFILKASFEDIAKDVYKARVENVDFRNQGEEVIEKVNLWAEKASEGLIKNLLSPGSLHKETMLVLANALYFKGTWLHAFETSRTREADFHLLSGATEKVRFMTAGYGRHQFYGSFDGFKVLKLPYQKGQDKKQFSTHIFLPHKKDGLQELIEKMNSDSRFLDDHLELVMVQLSRLEIPKLKFSSDLEASYVMKELGLTLPFKPTANFLEMGYSAYDGLYISKIIHKSYIEVNEKGTEATAITLSMMAPGYSPSPGPPLPSLPSFVADHPFIFMIKEEASGVILFIGAVLNPLLES